MTYRFRTAIGRVVPILGTGEIKSRREAWGKKLLTFFWKLLEETRSTADLNSVEHRSRTLLLVYFSNYESTTLLTIYPTTYLSYFITMVRSRLLL